MGEEKVIFPSQAEIIGFTKALGQSEPLKKDNKRTPVWPECREQGRSERNNEWKTEMRQVSYAGTRS